MLQVWLELGLIGVFLLGSVVIICTKRARVVADDTLLCAIAIGEIFAVISVASVSHGIWQSW